MPRDPPFNVNRVTINVVTIVTTALINKFRIWFESVLFSSNSRTDVHKFLLESYYISSYSCSSAADSMPKLAGPQLHFQRFGVKFQPESIDDFEDRIKARGAFAGKCFI